MAAAVRGRQRDLFDPCVSHDPCAEVHAVCWSDHGLRITCPHREVAPEWVRAYVPTEWVERSGERLSHERLPKEEQERKQYANQVGRDGWAKLPALDAASTADWLKSLPAVMTLRTSLPTTVRAARARRAMANGTGSASRSTYQLPL
jgi:hypothetical protein